MSQVGEKERKILVAVDEGEESMYALSWCLKNLVSDKSEDTIVLLYAKPNRPVFVALDGTGERESPEGYIFSSDTMAAMERHSNGVAEGVMEKAKRICDKEAAAEVKVDMRVEPGDPRDVICEVAERLKVNVAVLGSHGYGLIKRAFLGSVSNHCAQNLKCPVLIVKKPK